MNSDKPFSGLWVAVLSSVIYTAIKLNTRREQRRADKEQEKTE